GIRDLIDRTVGSSPSRMAIFAFGIVIIFFTVMLMLPLSSNDGHAVAFHHALFTATSAVTVTGLTTVSTALQWSVFGQLMILLAFQIGGLGTLTMTSLLAMAVGRKLGLRAKLIAQEAMNIGKLGELGSVLKTVAVTSI
ncbi:TrkH family potassium uptake protein, partial [Ursidibacter maritimus]|nr:TrkH family potassium uptake protein [Ursidibacter maritimus]